MAQIDILNAALPLIGQSTVSSLTAGTSKAADTFNALWPQYILAYTLSIAPWKALRKRAVLVQPSLSVSAGSVAGGTITLTVGAHSLSVGQTIYLAGVTPTDWNGTYAITAVTGTTISFASGATDSYVSGGTVTWAPIFDWSYVFDLPSDCLRPIKVNNVSFSNYYGYTLTGGYYPIGSQMPPFKIEGTQLLSNESSVDLLYTTWDYQNYTPPANANLVNLLIARTAATMAYPMERDVALEAKKEAMFEFLLRRIRITDAMEDTPDELQEDDWIVARM